MNWSYVFAILSIILVFVGIFWFAQKSNAQALADKTEKHGVISPMQFQEKLINTINRNYPDLCLSSNDKFTLNMGLNPENCDDVVISTENLYNQYITNPSDLEFYVNRLANTAAEAMASLDTPTEISEDLLAVVLRNKSYVEFLGERDNPERSLWKPFHGDLIALLVANHPKHVASITESDLKILDIDQDAAWSIAKNNLQSNFNNLIIQDNNGAKLVTSEDGVATGHLWLKSCDGTNDNFDAIVVDKESYAIANSGDQEATNILAGYAAQLITSNQSLSDNLISCYDANWYASHLSNNSWQPIQ